MYLNYTVDKVSICRYWVVKILVKKINWRCPNLLSLLRLRAFRPSRSSPVSRSHSFVEYRFYKAFFMPFWGVVDCRITVAHSLIYKVSQILSLEICKNGIQFFYNFSYWCSINIITFIQTY